MISLVKEPPPGMVVDVEQAEQNLNVLVHNKLISTNVLVISLYNSYLLMYML